MGVLRLLLAVSVIAAHAGPLFGTSMLPGNFAVETFFMISGFYMSLILSEKYCGPGAIWKFYSNRYLRLYPTYFIIVIATWAWFFVVWAWLKHIPGNSWIEYYGQMTLVPKMALVFSNWSMFGLDIPSLFHFKSDKGFLLFHYYDTATAPDGASWLGDMRTIGQAWSVGLEIWFIFWCHFLFD